MMKAVPLRILLLFLVLSFFSTEKLTANGCTGSWFTIAYSPWCNCYQVCGNYISDCDQLVSVNWDFGDGTPNISGGSPCHHYANPGTYTITMTVVAYCHTFLNLWTTTCYITQQQTVTSTAPVLTANFAADTVCLTDGTQFTNTTLSPANSSNQYTWLFGDGTTGSATNPQHTYDSCGVYDVTLIVKNSTPCCSSTGADTIHKKVFVNCPPFDHSNQLGRTYPYIQESSAQIAITSGTCAGDTTHFVLTPSGPIASWQWVFPDSSTSTSATPSYVYTACPPAINYTHVDLLTNRGCPGIIDSVTGIFCPSNIGLSSTTTLCRGQCSGTATVNMSGGTPPYTVVWNDPANQTTLTATGLCPPGPYNATVTDGNGCHATPPVPVTVNDFPTVFSGIVTVQGGARCFGANGGSAVLNLTGGTRPYTYFWPNGTTDSSVTGLPGGTNTVNATDAHGCTFSTNFVIPQPPPITATIAPVNTGCNVCTGTATITPAGGNGTYVYTWFTIPVQTTRTATGLCAGVYQVKIEDAIVTGCDDTMSVAINSNGSQPITAATVTNATCSNICNGSAAVTLTGGCLSPPCTISWLDSSGTAIGQSVATATNLCAGRYTVQVLNGTSCKSFANVTIGVPNPIIPTLTSTHNTCASCNGSITVSATGGNAPYTYQWFDSTNTVIAGQTAATINNLCAGRYSVHVTDQQGCIATANTTVINNLLTGSATATSVKCNGDCNGMITAVASGGITPYTFIARNSLGVTVDSGSSSIIANLCAGNYTMVITDAGNCAITLPMVINQPAAINPVASTVLPLCFGGCNGSVSVTVTGGTPPYAYQWNYLNGPPLPGGTAATVNNLCAGGYVVKVSDTFNCVTPFIQVPLNQPGKLWDSLAVVSPYCNGGLGSLTAIDTGGTPPYSYTWSTGAVTQTIINLPSGTYKITVTDAHGCITNDSTTFAVFPVLTAQIIATTYGGYNFQCGNAADGEVVLRVNGGLPPYTYVWNDSMHSTVDSIYGLTPGIYTVTIHDAHNCVYVDSIALNAVPPVLSAGITPHNVTCFGDSSGSIAVTPVGGIPPYLYYWNMDTSLAHRSVPLTGIGPGNYTLTLYDSIRCVIFDTVFITQPPPMAISHSTTNTSCNGGADGTVTLTVNGGILPYTYSWNGGAYTTQNITGVPAGQYIVNVLDSNNCKIADTATVTQPAAITTQLTPVNVKCFGGADGSISLLVTGGLNPFGYNWNNGLYATKDLQNIAIGKYVVVVTDANGCTVTDSTTISQPNLITGSRQVSICVNDSFYTGGAFQKTPGTYYDTLLTPNNCDSVLATNLTFVNQLTAQLNQTVCFGQGYVLNGVYYSSGGTYVDTLKAAGGCDSIITLTLNVLPDLGIYAVPTQATLSAGDNIAINILSTTGAGIANYTWTPPYGLNCYNCASVIAAPVSDTRYTVVAIDSNDCRDTLVIPIFVKGVTIYVPNVFTPNGDGVNDFFQVFGNLKPIVFFEVMVFNRIGEKVFESNDVNFKWDGTYKGVLQNPAVFVWVIKMGFYQEPVNELRKGSVTLVR